jgi:tetratricopeptide (TPR) repeat protein
MKKSMLLCLVILAFLNSCQMQKIMVNVYSPPRLVLPPDVRAFIVTSRYVPATGPYEDVQWGAYESVDSVKWSLSESIVDTLAKRMVAGNKYLVKVKHFPRMLRHNDATFPVPLPWEGLTAMAKKEYVQALLVIEGFGLSKTPVAVAQNNGDYLARFSVGVTLALRIYEPEKMRWIDDSLYTFSTEFKGSGKTEQEARQQLPNDGQASLKACANAADNYFAMINPGQQSAKRYYYNTGDSSMLKADTALRAGKWGRAESTWKWLAYNAPDSIIQAKASYNMALACERDGRLNQAMGFIRRSQRIYPDKNTLKYIGVLNKKTLEFENQINQKKIIRRW